MSDRNGGSVLAILARELDASMRSASAAAARLLLWFDPDGEFVRVTAQLGSDLAGIGAQLRVFEASDSQLNLKLALLDASDAEPSTVLYLPHRHPGALLPRPGGVTPVLWALADRRFVAPVWSGGGEWSGLASEPTTSLTAWLKRHGVEVRDPRGEITAGEADSRLARYVGMRAGTDPSRWPRPLSVREIDDELAGSPAERVMELIVRPRRVLDEWGDNRVEVLGRIGQEFGLHPSASTGPEIADDIVGGLALTEAWAAFGQRSDFPFMSRLPRGSVQRERVVKLVRESLLRRMDTVEPFLDRVRHLEAAWHALDAWAADIPGQSLTLAGLTKRRLDAVLAAIESDTAERRDRSIDRLAEVAGDGTPLPGPVGAILAAMRAVASMAAAARSASAAAGALSTARDLVRAYGADGGWWQVDQLYLRCHADMMDEPSMSGLRRLADRVYVEYLTTANERFATAVEERGAWPPVGTELLGGPRWTVDGKYRGAIIITDAMRLHVAREVAERVGPDCRVEVGMSTLPTTTPFGMAALMPGEGALTADFNGPTFVLRRDDSPNLAQRQGRRDYLEAQLGATMGAKGIDFVELSALLEGQPPPSSAMLVVLDYALDDRGHGQGSLPEFVSKHAGRLARAIARLHEAGCRRVQVVTDHGFLHQPGELIDAIGHPPFVPAQAYEKKLRYAALKPDAPVEGLIRLACPLVPDLMLGFPRGIRSLQKAEDYLHGGISLQETVIPRLVSESASPRVRLQVDILVATDRLTGGTVVAKLRPSVPEGQIPLSGVAPRSVKLWIERADQPGTPVSTAEPVEELRLDTPEYGRPLYLAEGLALEAGMQLTLRAQDEETGETIVAVPLTLVVPWE